MRPPEHLDLARALAREIHTDQVDKGGAPMLDHVQRVVDRVPSDAKRVAYVHDICERSPLSDADVAARVGLDADEQQALVLLTKRDAESVIEHTQRVVREPAGRARDLAIAVKRADVDDHLAQGRTPQERYRTAAALLQPVATS